MCQMDQGYNLNLHIYCWKEVCNSIRLIKRFTLKKRFVTKITIKDQHFNKQQPNENWEMKSKMTNEDITTLFLAVSVACY